MSAQVTFDRSTADCKNKILILEKRGKLGQYVLKAVSKNDAIKIPKGSISKISKISEILNSSSTVINSTEPKMQEVCKRIHLAAKKHNNSFIRQLFKAIIPKLIFDLLRFPCLVVYKEVNFEDLKNRNTFLSENPVSTSPSFKTANHDSIAGKAIKDRKEVPEISQAALMAVDPPQGEIIGSTSQNTIKAPQAAQPTETLESLARKKVFGSLINPYLKGLASPTNFDLSLIGSSFGKSGELQIQIDTSALSLEAIKDLKGRLEMNHRIENLAASQTFLQFTVPNHHLIHLFSNDPKALSAIYASRPDIKQMHEAFGQGCDLKKLTANKSKAKLSEAKLFLKEGLPGDYIIVSNPKATNVLYKTPEGNVESFSFSEFYKSFSSYRGMQHLKRPFLFRKESPEKRVEAHNAFLHFKNVSIVNRLVEYSRSGIRSPVMGAVDDLLEMEDLIAWYENLPEGKMKKEYFQPICTFFSETFGHFNSMKGEAYSKEHKIRLEGMHPPLAKSQISEAVLRYLPKTALLSEEHRAKLKHVAKNSVNYSNKGMHIIDNVTGLNGNAAKKFEEANIQILEDLSKGLPVSITTGWTGHAVEVTLYTHQGITYLMYTNRGASLDKDLNTKLYRVGAPLTSEMIGHLRRPPSLDIKTKAGPKNLGAYFYAPQSILDTLDKELKGQRPKTMAEEFQLDKISTIAKSKQKAGNCTVANGKGLFQNSVFLLKYSELLDKGSPAEAAIKSAQSHASKASKELQHVERAYQMGVWRRFSASFKNEEIKYAKKHFEFFQKISHKAIKNKSKNNKLYGTPSLKDTLIVDALEMFKAEAKGFVRDCPYDIAACLSEVPLNAGTFALANAPEGSFGLYKTPGNGKASKATSEYKIILRIPGGKAAIIPINKNQTSGEHRYQIELEKGMASPFTTLGELAALLEKKGIILSFAL